MRDKQLDADKYSARRRPVVGESRVIVLPPEGFGEVWRGSTASTRVATR